MYFMLDNYDSFVYNLRAYIEELGREVLVCRPENINCEKLEQLDLEGIIISPGPGHPAEARRSLELIEYFKEKVPILGVCLGHQVLAHYFGANVEKGQQPMHGKLSPIKHNKIALFKNLPDNFQVTRYHSLVVSPNNFPENLQIDAETADGVIMALSAPDLQLYGVQFHPEALLTEYGHELLQNFLEICERKHA